MSYGKDTSPEYEIARNIFLTPGDYIVIFEIRTASFSVIFPCKINFRSTNTILLEKMYIDIFHHIFSLVSNVLVV